VPRRPRPLARTGTPWRVRHFHGRCSAGRRTRQYKSPTSRIGEAGLSHAAGATILSRPGYAGAGPVCSRAAPCAEPERWS
jgi:hypothetical protein